MDSTLTQLRLGSIGAPSIPAHRLRIEGRMEELESELMALKVCYNSFALINHLPTEVMSNVLVLHATEVMDDYPTWHKKSISWITSTHVCRRWRSVALDCPTLWSRILFPKPEVAEYMVELSRGAPLTVETSLLYGTSFIDVFSYIFAQSHRLRTLCLSGVAVPHFVSALATPTPIMEKLALSTPSSIAINLPTNFLQGQAPILRHLEVHHLAPRMWASLPLGPRITFLELSSETPGSHGLSPKELLNSLRRMPLLHTLILSDMLPVDQDGYPQATQPDFPTLSCPALRMVKISDSIKPITAFIGGIDIPVEAKVSINFPYPIRETRYVEDFLAILVTSWVQKFQAEIKGLVVSENNSYHSSSRDLTVRYFFDCPPIQDSDSAQLVISFLDSRPKIKEYIATLNQYLDLFALTYLMLEGKGDHPVSGSWVPLFSDLRNLETITLRNISIAYFLEALGDTSSQLPFPSLSTVDLLDIAFTSGFSLGRPWSVVGDLVIALTGRALVCPIGFLRISECKHFGGAAYSFIRESLPELLVEWDEVVLTED